MWRSLTARTTPFLCAILLLAARPAEATDAVVVTVTNNSAETAADLHVTFSGAGGNLFVDPMTVVALDCPTPSVPSNPPTATDTAVIDWGTPCVPPDSTVTFIARSTNGPLGFQGGVWTDAAGGSVGTVDAGEVGLSPAPPGGGPLAAIKIQIRYLPLGGAFYTPWRRPPGARCFSRFCWNQGFQCQYRLLFCPFSNKFNRLLELPPWIPLGGWRNGRKLPPFCGWQFRTTKPPRRGGGGGGGGGGDDGPFGPPPDTPETIPAPFPGSPFDLHVRYSDDGGLTFREATDLSSAFFAMSRQLQVIVPRDFPEIVGFENILRAMAPNYATAAQPLEALSRELEDVLASELGPKDRASLEASATDLAQLSRSLGTISTMFAAGRVDSAGPFADSSAALHDLSRQIGAFHSRRFDDAAESIRDLGENFATAAAFAAAGLDTTINQDFFLWPVVNGIPEQADDVASATYPHVRLRLDMEWEWEPSTIDSVFVLALNPETGAREEAALPVSNTGEIDLTAFGQENLLVWVKAPTFLSEVVKLTSRDGRHVRLRLTGGDADGNNCVDALDLEMVQSSLGSGGPDAESVPSSDVNGDGIVDGRDVEIVLRNLGKCGEPLPVGAGHGRDR